MTIPKVGPWLAFLIGCLLAAGPTRAEDLMPGIVDLGGPWWLSVESKAAGAGEGVDATRWVELPGSWQALRLTGHDGTLRFRREIVLPVDWKERLAPSGLAILVDEAKYGAYSLSSGDQILGGFGGDAGRIPAPAIRVFALPSSLVDENRRLSLELYFHRVRWASDLAAASGPVGEKIFLGDSATLRSVAELETQQSHRNALHSILLTALLAAVGLYHLQLFSRRQERVEYLWFGLTALDFAAVVFAVRLSYTLVDSYTFGRRSSAVAIHLAVVLLIQLLWPYLGQAIGPWLRRYQISHGAIAAAVVVFPIEWVVASNAIRWLWILPLLAGLGQLLAWGSWRGDPDARTIGLGGLAVVGAGIAELVFQVLGRGTTYPLPAWSFGFFALGMAVSLSNRYSRLHLELDEMRFHLEQEVEDATVELSTTNSKLRAENTERQVAEESMRMLERAVEQSIDGIIVADLAGATQFLNEAWAQMHDYEVPEILGYDLNLFHTREQMQEQVYPLLNQVREHGSFNGEVEHRQRDGSTFPTWMTVNLLRDPEGEAVGIVAIARDITARRQNEEEQLELESRLQQTAKLESLGDLAAGIAHDYNNLLTGVMVHADLALQGVDDASPAYEKIRQIVGTAERAADLSDQLLAFAGEDEPELETLDLGQVLAAMEPQLRERIPPGIVLQFQLKKNLPPVDVDVAQLRRVVLRLVANATDAIGQRDGVITLRTSKVAADEAYLKGAQPTEERTPGEYVFFEVSDSGRGIDEEMRGRIFDPFFTTKPQGRGLGLATALGIVGAHSGAIKLYSEPGRGSTFEVLFPASKGREIVQRPKAGERWNVGGAILVVDDEDLVLEVTREILESRGIEVLTAAGGKEALAIFDQRRGEIAAVVLDMTMPEMDGEEVFRQLRQLDPEARVILMSGYSRKKVPRRVFENGLGGFLHKPFRPQDLIDKLRETLDPSG
ncbi:MAG: response regulator [Acidobacteriota bacterium]